MNDFEILVKILVAIQAGQDSGVFDVALVNSKTLGTSDVTRDRIAARLQKEGYIDGLVIVDDVDNTPTHIVWSHSKPELTIAGMEYVASNEKFRKVLNALKGAGIAVASQVIANTIQGMTGG